MKNILLADDHSIVRMGVKSLLMKGLPEYIVDEAEDESDIEMWVKQKKYQLIILDIDIPQGDFVKLMHWLLTITPDANILIFSMHDESIYGQRCLQLGAKGYLHKSANDNVILNAINRVLSGKKYISPDLAELLSDNKTSDSSLNPLLKLSLREMEIMLLLNKGRTLAEICEVLKIQYSTVSTFKHRIMEKLNVKSMHSLYKFMQSYNLDTY